MPSDFGPLRISLTIDPKHKLIGSEQYSDEVRRAAAAG
jgi:hypothetical protein